MKTINYHRHNKPSTDLTKFLLWIFVVLFSFFGIQAQTISVWRTQGNGGDRLSQKNSISFSNSTVSNPTITINQSATRQSIDGFGFMLTQGSAKLIRQLSESEQNNLLKDFFDPNSGISNAIVRISIGASDLSDSVYFYNNTSGDVNMNDFSLTGPDSRDLLPILKKIVAMNPSIKILATPWSAPTWMKTNNGAIGGSLRTEYHAAYANYFVKYLEAMDREGIQIWGITPQNEPLNPNNEPSMFMEAAQQTDFINNHLGPAIASSSYSPKIIAYDHNCDRLDFPIQVVNNSSFVDGAGFHLYDPGANIEGMSEVRNQTGKNVYFTEQFTSSNGNFDGDFGWHMENVVIGASRNWSKTVIEWNLASGPNPEEGPKTPGGCTECLGAITIDNTNVSRNVSYYIIGQISKFVKPGAQRVDSNGNLNVAFKNPDGSSVLLVYNKNQGSQSTRVNVGGKSFQYTIPGRTAVTFVWSGSTNPTTPNPPMGVTATAGDKQIRLQWNASNGATEYVIRRSASPEGSYSTIKTGVTATSYTNTGLTNGQRYWYEVRARNSAGTSESSTAVSAIPEAPSTGIVSGSVYEIKNRASGKVIDVSGRSTANGARIQQWGYAGGDNQHWRVESTGNDQYKLTAIHSGKVMDVVDGSTLRGAKIQQWDDFGSSNQRWKIESTGGGYYRIVSVKSNMALDVPGGDIANGVQLIQWTAHGQNNQQWSFRPIADKLSNDVLPSGNLKDILLVSNPTDGNNFSAYFSSLNTDRSAMVSIIDISGRIMYQFLYEITGGERQKILLDPYVKSLQMGHYFIKINEKSASFLKL